MSSIWTSAATQRTSMWITARDASPACFQLFFFPANNNKCLEWDSCLQALTEQNGSCGIKANEKYCVDASVYHNLFINLLILLLSAFRAIASHLHSILLLLLLDMKRKYTNALRSASDDTKITIYEWILVVGGIVWLSLGSQCSSAAAAAPITIVICSNWYNRHGLCPLR